MLTRRGFLDIARKGVSTVNITQNVNKVLAIPTGVPKQPNDWVKDLFHKVAPVADTMACATKTLTRRNFLRLGALNLAAYPKTVAKIAKTSGKSGEMILEVLHYLMAKFE
jgi:hypothetical protein